MFVELFLFLKFKLYFDLKIKKNHIDLPDFLSKIKYEETNCKHRSFRANF